MKQIIYLIISISFLTGCTHRIDNSEEIKNDFMSDSIYEINLKHQKISLLIDSSGYFDVLIINDNDSKEHAYVFDRNNVLTSAYSSQKEERTVKFKYEDWHLIEITEYDSIHVKTTNQYIGFIPQIDSTVSSFITIKKTGEHNYEFIVKSNYECDTSFIYITKLGEQQIKKDTLKLKNNRCEYFCETDSFEGVLYMGKTIDVGVQYMRIFFKYPMSKIWMSATKQ